MHPRVFGVVLSLAVLAGSAGLARADDNAAIDVSLGDVSLNKVAFLVAEDNGIYKKYGLDVHQFITAKAAQRDLDELTTLGAAGTIS